MNIWKERKALLPSIYRLQLLYYRLFFNASKIFSSAEIKSSTFIPHHLQYIILYKNSEVRFAYPHDKMMFFQSAPNYCIVHFIPIQYNIGNAV